MKNKKLTVGLVLVFAALAWAGTFTTDYLNVNKVAVLTQVNTPTCAVAPFAIAGPRQDDWNPACLATNSTISVTGADNNGTWITGLDAIDNGASTTVAVASDGVVLPQATISVTATTGFFIDQSIYLIYVTSTSGQQTVSCTGVTSTTFTGCTGGVGTIHAGGSVLGGIALGTIRTICNLGATTDDGAVVLGIEDSNSKSNNRVWADFYIASSYEDRFRIGTAACVPLIYSTPNPADATIRRWVVQSQVTDVYHSLIQNFELFPHAAPSAITGTLNNWNPQACPSPTSGSCEAGGSTLFEDYSVVVISTVDGTGATITGMVGPGVNSGKGEGQIKILINGGPGPITITHHDGGSTTTNYFSLPNGVSIQIPATESRIFYTTGTSWLLLGNGMSYTGLTSGVGSLLRNDPTSSSANRWIPATMTDNSVVTTNGSITMSDMTAVNNGNSGLLVSPSGAGITTPSVGVLTVGDTRSLDTTGGVLSVYSLYVNPGLTRSAGGNGITEVAAYLQATAAAGVTGYALQTGNGSLYLGLGTGAFAYANFPYWDFSTDASVEHTLKVGGGDFNGNTRTQACAQSTFPTANHGTLSADSGNCVGEITGIGANTSVTITYGGGGFGTSSHCIVTVEGATAMDMTVTPSKTAPVVNCFTVGGIAANCPDFTYQCWGH